MYITVFCLLLAIYYLFQLNKDNKERKAGTLVKPRVDLIFFFLLNIFLLCLIFINPIYFGVDKVIYFIFAYYLIKFFQAKAEYKQKLTHIEIGAEAPKLEKPTMLWFVSVLIFVKAFIINPYFTPTGSMLPTIQTGMSSPYLVNKLAYGLSIFDSGLAYQWSKPKRGDIILFSYETDDGNVPYMKRVIGVEGDLVYYHFDTKTYVVIPKDGEALTVYPKFIETKDDMNILEEKFAGRTYQIQQDPNITFASLSNQGVYKDKVFDNPKIYQVKEGEMFVMGDNRDWSYDSRFFGPVKQKQLIGKMLFK